MDFVELYQQLGAIGLLMAGLYFCNADRVKIRSERNNAIEANQKLSTEVVRLATLWEERAEKQSKETKENQDRVIESLTKIISICNEIKEKQR